MKLNTLNAPQAASRVNAEPMGYQPDAAWKMDRVLELWVNVETTPVTIGLAGVLDDLTCTSVVQVVEELLGEGYRGFIMMVDDLDPIGSGGFSALTEIDDLVRGARGTLVWSSWPDRSYARPSDHVD